MNQTEYSSFDGLGLARLVNDKAVRPIELTQIAADAAEQLNPELNAIVDVYSDRVSHIDKETKLDGPFAGVPFLVKDIGTTEKDRPQCSGSRLGVGYTASQDSYLTRSFKRAGFNIFGRTNLPEFAQAAMTENSHFGDTRNPWDLRCSPGGSSGGAAAAVAAGIVPIAHGTDTGGSIRIPAACCGIVGLKPSRGRVSKGPQLDETLYGGLNTEFVLTRSIRDAAVALDSVCGYAPGDPFALSQPDQSFAAASGKSLRALRVAVQTDSPFASIAPDVAAAAEHAARVLEAEGHIVIPSSPPVDADDWTTAERIIWIQSTAWEIKRLSAATGNPINSTTLEPLSLAAHELSNGLTADDWFGAKRRCNSICRSVGSFFEDVDILITPTLACTAPRLGVLAGSDIDDYDTFIKRTGEFSPFTSLFNITGQPAISLPLAMSESALPIGVQFVAQFGNEALLLQLATFFEQAMPWRNRQPPVHVTAASSMRMVNERV
jgi:amidase